MFAQQIIDGYTSQIDEIALNIQSLEAQLNALRTQQKELEAERQALSTLAGAGESAIDQARSFLLLASHNGREDMVSAFWDEMDSLRGGTTPQLPSVESEGDPDQPDSSSETIDVPVIDLEEDLTNFGNPVSGGADQPVGDFPNEAEIHALPIGKLRTLCKEFGLSTGGNKSQLRDRLLSLAT